MRTAPEALSTKLSMPKPRRATLPARTAAEMTTTPSTTFHPTVRYSSRRARLSNRGAVPEARSILEWRSRMACLLEAAPIGGLELEGAVFDVEVSSQAPGKAIEDHGWIGLFPDHDVGRHDVHSAGDGPSMKVMHVHYPR